MPPTCDWCSRIRDYSFMAEVKVFGITFFICNRCAEEKARNWIINPYTGKINQVVVNYFETALGKELE